MKKRMVFVLAAALFLAWGACEAGGLTSSDDTELTLAENNEDLTETEEEMEEEMEEETVGGSSIITTEYAVGDIILADGSAVQRKNLTAVNGGNLPVAVIADVMEDGTALGLGVHRSSEPLAWAPGSSSGNALRFTDLICMQKDGSENAITADFSGAVDGYGSWNAVCSMDSQDTKDDAENYPAFHFVNTYAETYKLEGTYASGWYMPSIAEVCAIYRNREDINAALQKLHQLDEQAAMDGLGTNWYWSSTQSGSEDDYAWFVHYFNGYVSDCPKDFTNLHVLAVHTFS